MRERIHLPCHRNVITVEARDIKQPSFSSSSSLIQLGDWDLLDTRSTASSSSSSSLPEFPGLPDGITGQKQ